MAFRPSLPKKMYSPRSIRSQAREESNLSVSRIWSPARAPDAPAYSDQLTLSLAPTGASGALARGPV